MRGDGADSAARMRKDGAHIRKDCSCDLQNVMERNEKLYLGRFAAARAAARSFASDRHHCATILQQCGCDRSDRSRWHQRDHGVEEVRVSEELRRCENVPVPAFGRMPTRSEGLCSTKARTGDAEMRIAQVAPLT